MEDKKLNFNIEYVLQIKYSNTVHNEKLIKKVPILVRNVFMITYIFQKQLISIMFDLYCPSNLDIRIQLIRRRYQQTQSKPNCYRYMTWLYINSLKNLWISIVVHFTGRSNELGQLVIRKWNHVKTRPINTNIYTAILMFTYYNCASNY